MNPSIKYYKLCLKVAKQIKRSGIGDYANADLEWLTLLLYRFDKFPLAKTVKKS
jgi:hypothetical protein